MFRALYNQVNNITNKYYKFTTISEGRRDWGSNSTSHSPETPTCIYSYFDKGCPTKTEKAYVTMPIGIMGGKSLALLDWVSRWFSNKEGESMNMRACAVSFCHTERPWDSIKQL